MEYCSLPTGFAWDILDINNRTSLNELYEFLKENYVEDDSNSFRLHYSNEFLYWWLSSLGFVKEWYICVRVAKNNKLVGFISAIPVNIRVFNNIQPTAEINFLCVHKKLRSKRMTPILIKELTKRILCYGFHQAVYTSGTYLPKFIARCNYWHRALNPRKLIDINFINLNHNITIRMLQKLYWLPNETKIHGLRPMIKSDILSAHNLLCEYFKSFDIAPIFTENEFEHWFLPRENIIYSYVIETKNKITDFISFYSVPTTILNHSVYSVINTVYSFYNVSTSVSWVNLIQDALIIAKNLKFDVFNALDVMDNIQFLQTLKFKIGTESLKYYIQNNDNEYNNLKIGLILP